MKVGAHPAPHYALVLAGLGAGGAEQVVAELARHWLEQGARVSVVAFDDPGSPIYHPLPAGAQAVRLGLEPGSAPFLPARRVVALRRWVSAARPTILFSFLTKINAVALAATVGTRVPVVACERNNPERQPMNPLWHRALALLYRRAAAIVCQTQASVRCLPAAARPLALVIPNPVPPQEAVAGAARRRVLIGVGRLTPQKGFDLLIDAFARVAAAFPDWTLEIWGEGPDRTALAARAQALGLGARVRLRGVSAVPRGWIGQGGTFVLASRYEGFPNVLGEAMAAGLPCLAADCDFGPGEMLEHGGTGLLVAAEDVNDLARGLARLMGDEPLRERLAAAGRQAALRFAPEHIFKRWDSLAEAILDRTVVRHRRRSPESAPA